MAVRLLAGPFNTTLNGAPDDLVVEIVPDMWLPGNGVMLASGNAGGWYAVPTGVMTLDGRFCDRSNEPMGYCGWWPAKKAIVQQSWYRDWLSDAMYELTYDRITFAQEKTGPDPLVLPGITPYIKLEDRRVIYSPDYNTQQLLRSVVNGQATPEGPMNPFPWFPSNGRVQPGRNDTEIFLEAYVYGQPSRCVFYDTVRQVWSSPTYTIGMYAYRLIYSTDFDVLVSCHNWVSEGGDPNNKASNQLRIWSLEVEPTILTDVVPLYGHHHSGQIVTYQVRVTGDHQDPCENELIDWRLIGSGVLLDEQTRTDTNGYATTRVQYGLADTGQVIVEASLKC